MAYEEECETADQLYDEWVMTRLRTRAGMCLDDLEKRFGKKRRQYAARIVDRHIADGCLVREALSGEAYAPWRDAFGYGVP